MAGEPSPAGDIVSAGDAVSAGETVPSAETAPVVAPTGLRASHADRDRVAEVLRIAAGDGRLTAEELDQRLEAALTARTLSELAVLTTDLPASADHTASALIPEARDLVRIKCGSGSTKRDGRWIVPQQMEVSVTSGSVKLDFTQAVISAPVLTLRADVKSGGLTLVTKPGIEVDANDVGVASGSVRVKMPPGPAVPTVLRIEVSGQVRSGSLKARPPRRTFLQWLLRQPAYLPR